MKNIFKKIIDFIISIFKYKEEEPKIEKIENTTTSNLNTFLEEKKESDINILETSKESTEVVENKSDEVIKEEETKKTETDTKEKYKMLTNKQRQTYLKALGLYTKTIDNVRGDGQKKAEKQFNTIFLNKKSETYTESTDKLLRKIYTSYKASKYMVDADWQYFKNFNKSEYKCKCKGKYCNGYPSKIAMKLVMADQYIRNCYEKSNTLTSGLRCKTHNKNEGGTSNSKHMEGEASDTYVSGKNASTVRKMLVSNSSTKLPFVYYCYDVTKTVIHKSVKL